MAMGRNYPGEISIMLVISMQDNAMATVTRFASKPVASASPLGVESDLGDVKCPRSLLRSTANSSKLHSTLSTLMGKG